MGLDKIQTLLISDVQTFGQFFREKRKRLLGNVAGSGQESQWYPLI